MEKSVQESEGAQAPLPASLVMTLQRLCGALLASENALRDERRARAAAVEESARVWEALRDRERRLEGVEGLLGEARAALYARQAELNALSEHSRVVESELADRAQSEAQAAERVVVLEADLAQVRREIEKLRANATTVTERSRRGRT